MDEQNKQHMMIGGLVALVLGAGAYFVAFRESDGPTKSTAIVENPIRKTLDTSPDYNEGNRRKPKPRTSKTERMDNIRREVSGHRTPAAGPRKGIKRGEVKAKKREREPMG